MSDIDLHSLSESYGRSFAGCELVVPGVNRTYRLTEGENAYYPRLYRPIARKCAVEDGSKASVTYRGDYRNDWLVSVDE